MNSEKNIINRRDFMKMSALTLGSTGLTQLVGKEQKPQFRSRPNIVFMLGDDMGMETIGCYGGTSYKTTNIDALAANGIRFGNCYSSPLCSPTRAQLLTGRYGFRTGIDCLVGKDLKLDTDKEVTLPRILKEAGYDTAITGKWHLCPKDETSEHITACDFDEQFCYKGGTIDYGTPENYLPDKHLDFALNYLETHQSSTKPFYLQYSFGLPHFPFTATPLNPNDPEGVENYPYMVEYLDILLGKIIAKINGLNMSDNTIIIFAGDNGTDTKITSTFNGEQVKGGKGRLKDTGSWVPLIVSGPGISPGTTCDDLVDFCDFFPTFAKLCDARMPGGVVIDGRSFAPQLEGQSGEPREWIYVQVNGTWFIRNKEYKLNNSDTLFDVTNSPFQEKITENDTVKKFLADEVERIKKLTTSSLNQYNRTYKSNRINILYLPSGQTIINIPQAKRHEKVFISIFNLKGKKIRQLVITGNRVVWNGKSNYGYPVVRGEYFIKATGQGWSGFGRIMRL